METLAHHLAAVKCRLWRHGAIFGQLTLKAQRHGYRRREIAGMRLALLMIWRNCHRHHLRPSERPLRAPGAWIGSLGKLVAVDRSRGLQGAALSTVKKWTPVLQELGFLALFSPKVRTPEGWKSVDSVWVVARNDEVDAFAHAKRCAEMSGARSGLTRLVRIRKAWSILTTQRNSLRHLFRNLLVCPTRIPPQFVPSELSPAQIKMREAFHSSPFEEWWREHGAAWRGA